MQRKTHSWRKKYTEVVVFVVLVGIALVPTTATAQESILDTTVRTARAGAEIVRTSLNRPAVFVYDTVNEAITLFTTLVTQNLTPLIIPNNTDRAGSDTLSDTAVPPPPIILEREHALASPLGGETGGVSVDGVTPYVPSPQIVYMSDITEAEIDQKLAALSRAIESDIAGVRGSTRVSDITRDEVDQKLATLSSKLGTDIARVRGSTHQSNTVASNFRAITHTNKIDNLESVTINNATVSGLSGLTDSDIPNDITASNYVPLSGNSTISGILTIASLVSTTTATSTFAGGVQTTLLNVTSTTATSTFANGIDVATGCVSINGTCISNVSTFLGLTDTQSNFIANEILHVNSSGNAATSTTGFVFTGTNLGIGTTSPYAPLSVVGEAVASHFTATSTTATSTFAGGLTVDSTDFVIDPDGGLVGIGTASPSRILDIESGGTDTRIELRSTGTNSAVLLDLFNDARNWNIGINSSDEFRIRDVTASAQRFTIDASGNVGIVNPSPSYVLDVTGNARFTSLVDAAHFVATSTTATSTFAGGLTVDTNDLLVDPDANRVGIGTTSPWANLSVNHSAGQTAFAIGSSTATSFVINADGHVGAGSTTPGERLVVEESDGNTNTRIALSSTGGAVPSLWYLNVNRVNGQFSFRNQSTNVNSFKIDYDVGGNALVLGGTGLGVGDSTPDAALDVSSSTATTLFRVDDSGDGDTSPFIIDGDGLVGIGTTSPISTLSIQGSLCVRDTGSCGTTAGTIYATTATITDIDLAENFASIDRTLSPGELVMFDTNNPEHIVRADKTLLPTTPVMGIVSTNPGLTLGSDIPDSYPVALAGRVPVKVNDENGVISIGDRITLSSVPGVGRRADSNEVSVALALTAPRTDPNTGDTTVIAFVENDRPDLSATRLDDLEARITALEGRGSASSGVLDVLAAVGARISEGLAQFRRVVVEDELCVGAICVNEEELRILLQNNGIDPLSPTPETPSEEADTSVSDTDTQPPTLTLNGANPAEIAVGATYSDLGVIVEDNVNHNLGYTLLLDGEVVERITLDTSEPREYTITYQATDQAGNTGFVERVVIVGDPESAEEAHEEESTEEPTTTQEETPLEENKEEEQTPNEEEQTPPSSDETQEPEEEPADETPNNAPPPEEETPITNEPETQNEEEPTE